MTGRLPALFTVPNLLTLARFPLAGLLWIHPDRPVYVLVIMVAAALSDVADGRIARRQRKQSKGDPERSARLEASGRIGAWLDPLSDKTFVVSVVVAFWVVREPPLWTLILIASRELILLPMFLIYRVVRLLTHRMRFDFRAGIPGKVATVLQFVTICIGLLGNEAFLPLAMLTGVVGVVAALDYVGRGIRLARETLGGSPPRH